MGSCFAREIEKFLVKNGMSAPMTSLSLPKEEMISGTPNEILNKYTPFSMLNELKWALTGETPPDEHLYLSAGDGLYIDPHLHPELKPTALERLKERRAMVSELTRSIRSTRVIILTMGLVEAWYDTASGLYLNGAPPKSVTAAEPDRFELHVLSYEDIITALNGMYALIASHCRADAELLITVSPVPFKASFTGRDALAANTYSKSVLRAAVEGFVRRHDNVDYFPSYEIVTLSDRAAAYWLDNIHVRPDMVGRIMNQVFQSYMPERASEFANAATEQRDEDISAPALYAQGVKSLKAGDGVGAIHHMQKAIAIGGDMQVGTPVHEVYTSLGIAAMMASQFALAETSLAKAIATGEHTGRAHFEMGRALSALKRSDEAVEHFTKAVGMTEESRHIWLRLGVELEKVNRTQEALEAFRSADGFGDANDRLASLMAAE
jgi:Flp pilus assembly protein TadD